MLIVRFCFADISIHAPRVGSDYSRANIHVCIDIISIHAPRVGSDILHMLRL